MVRIDNFTKALEVLKQKRKMSAEEFAREMGYTKYNEKYIVHVVIPKGLGYFADEEVKKCFILARDKIRKNYYLEWVCEES